jgi:hypothetical protein
MPPRIVARSTLPLHLTTSNSSQRVSAFAPERSVSMSHHITYLASVNCFCGFWLALKSFVCAKSILISVAIMNTARPSIFEKVYKFYSSYLYHHSVTLVIWNQEDSHWYMAVRSLAIRAMADLTINSKLRMNSGFEIPVLGYGVGGQLISLIEFADWLYVNRYIKRMSEQPRSFELGLTECKVRSRMWRRCNTRL